MTEKILYALALPESSQAIDSNNRRRQIASEGTLGPGQPAVTPISPEAETRTLSVAFYSRFAELSARELAELWSSDAIDSVPYTSNDSDTILEEGYYSLERAENRPSTATERRSQEFRGEFTRIGTRRTHWRAVKTAPTTEDNPFGAGSRQRVGISTRADKVRWFDETGGAIEDATAVDSVDGEHDIIQIYDIQDTSIDQPTLIFELDYRLEWPTDCRVWDDRGVQKYATTTGGGATVGSATVGSATVGSTTTALQWQRVFATDHEYVGNPTVENDILRVELAEDVGRIRVYEWNPSTTSYESVALGTSPWRLYDADLTRIGLGRIDAQIEFEDLNTGATHNLNMSLKRGYESILWTVPENEDPAPQGLIDRLSPIAGTSQEDPAAVTDVIKRSEVRR
jgi:hypothetical protein